MCEAVCHIGGLSNANADFEAEAPWRICTGEASRNWTDDQKKSEEAMIQSLIKNPAWICVDSGARESVCPAESFPDFEIRQTSKVGKKYRAAGDKNWKTLVRRDHASKSMAFRRQ